MGLPELIANTSSPGAIGPIGGGLAAEVNNIATKIKVKETPPLALQATGQFRIVIGEEIMLVTGGAKTTEWTVTREAEGSKAASHPEKAEIKQLFTVAALKELFGGMYPMDAKGNLALGTSLPAMSEPPKGEGTVAIGKGALAGYKGDAAEGPIAIGRNAGKSHVGGEPIGGSIFIGQGAGEGVPSSEECIVIGKAAGQKAGPLHEMVVIGPAAAVNAVGGEESAKSIVIGYNALGYLAGPGFSTTIVGAFAFGAAGNVTPPIPLSGTGNTVVGARAAYEYNYAAAGNTFVGSSAGGGPRTEVAKATDGKTTENKPEAPSNFLKTTSFIFIPADVGLLLEAVSPGGVLAEETVEHSDLSIVSGSRIVTAASKPFLASDTQIISAAFGGEVKIKTYKSSGEVELALPAGKTEAGVTYKLERFPEIARYIGEHEVELRVLAKGAAKEGVNFQLTRPNIGQGSYNVFLGNSAGYSEQGSNKLYIHNGASAEPLVWGDFEKREVQLFAEKVSLYKGVTPTARFGKIAAVSGASTQAQMATAVNELREACAKIGVITP